MKKAFSSVACMKENYKSIVNACVRYGLDGVEIRLGDNNTIFSAKDKATLMEIKKYFMENNVEITNLGSQIVLQKYDSKINEQAKEIMENATILGAKGIRIFLGNFAPKVKEVPRLDYEGIVKQLQEICEIAYLNNVEVWVETHNEFATGKVLKKLIEDVSHESLKIIWDIIHPLEDGENIYETWQYIGDKITHVHIKDGYDRKDPAWHDYYYTPLGEGTLPIKSVLQLLQSTHYEGYISFEWEHEWRSELKRYSNTLDYILTQYTDYLNNMRFLA